MVPGIVLVAVIVWAFYEPCVTTPSLPLAAVSPLTATVQSVAIKLDPWLKERKTVRIALRVPLPGIATVRAPLEGKIVDFRVRGGVNKHDQSEGSPTCYTLRLRTDEDDDIVIAIYGRRHISRFKASVAPGERVGHGRPLGFIFFATVVTVYLPNGSDCQLGVGERVAAGGSVLATLVRD